MEEKVEKELKDKKNLEERMMGSTTKEVYFSLIFILEYFQRLDYINYFISDDKNKIIEKLSNQHCLINKVKEILVSEKLFFLKDKFEKNDKIIEFFDSFFYTMEVFRDEGNEISILFSDDWNKETEKLILSIDEKAILNKKNLVLNQLKEMEEFKNSPSMTDILYPDSVIKGDSWD